MIAQAEDLAQTIGIKEACAVLNVPRSSLYRARQPPGASQPRPKPARALSADEKEQVRDLLNSERFMDSSPRQVYATLLDENEVYLCHWRTMYRILAEHDEVQERRKQSTHPPASKPHLVATGPKKLWSWDITKLKGPTKWTYYYLYVILDVYSRYVVGWLIAEVESATLAEELIAQTCTKEGIGPDQMTLHADRGSAMRSKTVAFLLADLGVTKSHARPYTPNDNPYSEAQFKTMKYRPDFPSQFGSLADARAWARAFFDWYNHQHRHSALGLLTPATVHLGQAQAVQAKRQHILQLAYLKHPERFVKGLPTPPDLPGEVWINQPQPQQENFPDLNELTHPSPQTDLAPGTTPALFPAGAADQANDPTPSPQPGLEPHLDRDLPDIGLEPMTPDPFDTPLRV